MLISDRLVDVVSGHEPGHDAPDVVRPSYVDADFEVADRRYLLTTGMVGYTKTRIIGRPSLATAEKGRALLKAFSVAFREYLGQLQ